MSTETENREVPPWGDPQRQSFCAAKDEGGKGPPVMHQPVPFSASVFKLLAKFDLFFYFFSPFLTDLIKQFLVLCHFTMKELSKVPYGNKAFHYFVLATHFLPW